ncbi:cytidine deaminase [Hyaloraphidium curvatum]|nr:cytidine deaminase [Hyaloraphidium curvatum]
MSAPPTPHPLLPAFPALPVPGAGPLPPQLLAQLQSLAVAARNNSYSPYSGFRVGCALLAEDGRVFPGANVENAAYTPCVCAERAALGTAASAGARRFRAVFVASDSRGWIFPCGVCRQVLREFSAGDLEVWCSRQTAGEGAEWKVWTLGQLLPHGFGPEDLGMGTGGAEARAGGS